TFQVTFTVTNHGAGDTVPASWADTVWLDRDRTRPTGSVGSLAPGVLVGSTTHSGVLHPGDSYQQTMSVTIPQGTSGDLFLTPWTNPYGTVREESNPSFPNPDDPNELDSNNYQARAIKVLLTPPADLEVSSIVAPAQANAGQQYTVSWTV